MDETKIRLQKRLGQYWKIERLNIFLLPSVAIYMVLFFFRSSVSIALVLALTATSWLLVVGTIALRTLYLDLEGEREFGVKWIPILARWRLPSLGVVLISLLACCIDMGYRYPRIGPTQWITLGSAILAVLEYINYYHVQLQHFDNRTDFQRLVSGRGFRRSHLSRAIAKWEAGRKPKSHRKEGR